MNVFREQMTQTTALLALISTVAFGWLLLKRQRRRWLYLLGGNTLLITIALLILSDAISKPLDNSIGLNNFSWWFAYSLGVCIICNMSWQAALTVEHRRLRILNKLWVWMAPFLLGFMALEYFIYIRHTSEWTPRIPRSEHELWLSVAFFLYGAVAALFTILPYRGFRELEDSPFVRIRFWMGNLVRSGVLVCFSFKTIYLFAAYAWGGFVWINNIALASMTITAALWLLALLPLPFLRRLRDLYPSNFYHRWQALSDLQFLQRELEQLLSANSSLEIIPLWVRLRHLQHVTYRTTVAILDGKRYLDGYIEASPQGIGQRSFPQWNSEQLQMAKQLYDLLHCVDNVTTGSIAEITRVLEDASKQLREAKSLSSWHRA